MSNQINYKQILADLSSIAYHHMQINSFGFGTLDQCTDDIKTKKEPVYTRMYVVPEPVIFNENQIRYKFAIIIMDQVDDDMSNLDDVLSDTMEITKDVWTVFYQSYTAQYGNFSWEIVGDWNPDIHPFTERFETTLAGWTMHIELSTAFDYTICGLPIEFGYGFPQDQSFESYRVIQQDFKRFAELHYQVNSYGFGPLEQITVDRLTKKAPEYTRMYIVPERTEFNVSHMHISYQIIVCDVIEDDLSNQEDVLSDTLEIMKDLFSEMYLSEYEADWNPTLEPFIERFESLLGGWVMNVSITQKFDFNRCVLPMRPFTEGLTWAEVAELWKNVNIKWKKV